MAKRSLNEITLEIREARRKGRRKFDSISNADGAYCEASIQVAHMDTKIYRERIKSLLEERKKLYKIPYYDDETDLFWDGFEF